MTLPRKYSLTALLSILALLLSACGAAANEPTIATAVAQTVQAQNTLAAQATPTEPAAATFTPPPLASVPPLSTKAPPTAPPTGGSLCTASASFVEDVTIPDKTIVNPGSTFTKTWRIKNTGTCSWDSSWKFVYYSGDLLGGATFYNFPRATAPGNTVDVPIVLTAPQDGGSYRGNWRIQSPWGFIFGDTSGSSFYVDIVVGSGTPVNNKTETAYGITNVTYDVSRTCKPANTFYTITANITSNGPVTAIYTWVQSDGNNKANNKITFTSADTKSVTREWSQNIGSSQNPRWVQVIITDPNYKEYSQYTLPPLCQ